MLWLCLQLHAGWQNGTNLAKELTQGHVDLVMPEVGSMKILDNLQCHVRPTFRLWFPSPCFQCCRVSQSRMPPKKPAHSSLGHKGPHLLPWRNSCHLKWVVLSSFLALCNFKKNDSDRKWMQVQFWYLGRLPVRGPSNTLRRCTAPRYPMLGPSIWVDSTLSKIPQFSSTDGEQKSEGATKQVVPAKKAKTLTHNHIHIHTHAWKKQRR